MSIELTLAFWAYTITVFSLGYTISKDINAKSDRQSCKYCDRFRD